MAWVAAVAAVGGALMQAHAAEKQKLREERAYREAGRRSLAVGSREAQFEERNKEFMHSRALLLAAASGGGVDDPGMVKVLGDLNAEGSYRMFSVLWTAQNEAAGLNFRADEAASEAKAIGNAAIFNAFTAGISAYAGAGGSFGQSAAAKGAGASGATTATKTAIQSPRRPV